MTPRFSRSALLLMAAVVIAPGANAVPVDIYAELSGGNQSFEADRTAEATGLPTDAYRFSGAAAVGVEISETVRLVAEYERSIILGNLARLAFRHQDQFVSVNAGTVFGVANSETVLLKPGIYTSVRFDIAGLMYAEFLSERTLRARPIRAGDYATDTLDLATGFYLPNAIFTLRYRAETLERAEPAATVIESATDYAAEVDVFAKNVPYRVLLTFAYRTLIKSFESTSQGIGFLILGTGLELDIGEDLTYRFDIDSSVYTFGRDALVGEFANDSYVFRATTGVILRMSR